MPTKVNLPDGRVVNFPDGMGQADIEKALSDIHGGPQEAAAPAVAPDSDAGAATALTSAARVAGGPMIRGVARMAANSPRVVQQVVRAGSKAVTGGVGELVAGTPGALIGGLMEGVIPTQSGIRETAGRLAGEAPAVAKAGGRAQGIVEYGRSMGMNLKPSNIVPSPANPALDAYANSQGAKILRLYGPNGEQVVGPGTISSVAEKAPGIISKAVRATGSVLPWLQGGAAIGDLDAVVEPKRQDIGFFGVGPSVDVPGAKPPLLNALAEKVRAAILARLQRQP